MPPTDPAVVRGPTRRDPMLLWIAAAILLAARVVLGIREERHPSRGPDLVSWVDIASAPAVSRLTGRPILYDFTAEWCGPCQLMEREVYGVEKQAHAVSRLVVPVKVLDRQREDGRNSALVDSLQRAHNVTAFPTLVVVDSAGRAVERLEGYPGASQLMIWMARVSATQRKGARDGVKLTFP